MRVATLFAFACALGACGSGGSESTAKPAEAAAGGGACDILTEADAEKALGHKVKKLDATGGAAGLDICQYGWEGQRIADTGNVSVTVQSSPLAGFRYGVVEAGMPIEEMPALGDGAFWAEDVGLYVGKGDRTALYSMGGAGIADQKAAAVALARATLSRL